MKKLILGGVAILVLAMSEARLVKATYYHDKYHGRKSADGSVFNQERLTAASNNYKLGDSVRVLNVQTGQSVDVKITDRMAKQHNSRIDLSKRAFRKIASLNEGIIDVKVKKL